MRRSGVALIADLVRLLEVYANTCAALSLALMPNGAARRHQMWPQVPRLLLRPSTFTDISLSTISRAQTSKYGNGGDWRRLYLVPAACHLALHQLMRPGTDARLRSRFPRSQSRGGASAGQGERAFPALAAAQLLQRARQIVRFIDMLKPCHTSHARCAVLCKGVS